ncbi:hypothetical protein VPNG_05446 [Cytospora leucostoma]|uniref:Splicing factor YJU2 n=1 Tax=Cytospora leucostoma TaxID=1230097 RepID=A0A423XBF5_9PEZI|nr:hypothetical protein VPNG_05446 [Cytospora leucostoma]
MSERKVTSKYYPADFDYRQIPRGRGPKKAGPEFAGVTFMAPSKMGCTKCSEWIGKGRKFNAKKERLDETYFGIQIIRLHIKCPRCSAGISIETDPKNTDYRCESGAKRSTESWRLGVVNEAETHEQRLVRLQKEDKEMEAQEAMDMLKARVISVHREISVADALNMIFARNERQDSRRPEVNKQRTREEEKEKEEEDAAALARALEMERLKIAEEDVVVDDNVSLPLFSARKPRRVFERNPSKGHRLEDG